MTSYLVGKLDQDIAMNDAPPLAHISGPIVLAGAGKMGGAMLSGWLGQGLDPHRVRTARCEDPHRRLDPGASRSPDLGHRAIYTAPY